MRKIASQRGSINFPISEGVFWILAIFPSKKSVASAKAKHNIKVNSLIVG